MTKVEQSKDLKKYSKLLGKVDYDKEAVQQLAEALNEITELNRRSTQLRQIVEENQELHQFVWTTAEGVNLALHNIETDHLENIMKHLLATGRPISRSIRSEAISRDLVIPIDTPHFGHTGVQLLGSKSRNEEEIW